MDFLKSLIFEWQNAVFAAAIVFWTLYIFVEAINPGAGSDASHDMDHDVDHDTDHDHDHDSETSGLTGALNNILGFFGIGKCPLGIILMTLGISWGFFGLCSNGILASLRIIPPFLYFWVSLVVATVAGLIFTRLVASRVAKLMPKSGTTAVGLEKLVGRSGEATVEVDEQSGRARVRDEFGTLHNVYCRIEAGDESIRAGEQLLLLQYFPTDKIFLAKKRPVMSRS